MVDEIKKALENNGKVLVIMRGVPGSGKSTKAKQLWFLADDTKILSTDDVCTAMNGGVYKFEPRKLGMYHRINQDNARKCMQEGVQLVIIDNTNIKRRDFASYVENAHLYGYTVVEYKVGVTDFTNFPTLADDYRARNTHGVPLNTILRMGMSYEE